MITTCNQILINIQSSIQYIVDAVIGLLFQPLYAIVAIIQALIEIWSGDVSEDVNEDAGEQQQYTVYPSANEGKYPEECEYPIGRRRIGFHTNQEEVDELNKVREQLNK